MLYTLRTFARRFARPAAVRQRPHRARPVLEELEGRRLLSITLLNDPGSGNIHGFTGLASDHITTAPDASAAAGPAFLLETVNSNIVAVDRATGALSGQQTLQSFFAPAGATLQPIQPEVKYDELAGRFVVTALETDQNTQSFLDIAVSNDNNPQHGFTEMHRLNVGEVNGSGTFAYGDFDRLGFNADAYMVSLGMVPVGSGTYDHQQLITITKSSVLDANNATFTEERPIDILNFASPLVPATMHGSVTGDPMWLLGAASTSSVEALRIDNPASPSPTLTGYQLAVASFTNPPPASQLNGSSLSTLDARILTVATRNNRLVASQTVGTGGVAHARWYDFSIAGTSPSLTQWGEINRGAGVSTWAPSIDISAGDPGIAGVPATTGDLGLTFLESSANEYLSAYVTGQRAGFDAAGTMETPSLLAAGQSAYFTNNGAPYPTGRFSSIAVDPVNGFSFWAANEYAAPQSGNPPAPNNWGTALTKFTLNNTRFVNQMYLDLLARAPDAYGGSNNNLALDNGSYTRQQIAGNTDHSHEYHQDLVIGWYTKYLHRTPTRGSQEIVSWVNSLDGGSTDETVQSGILASDEYFNDHGSTNKGYVDALYNDLLGRQPNGSEDSAFITELNNGTSRTTVAMQFLTSTEYRQDLVRSYYQSFLHRAADSYGLNAFVTEMANGTSDEDVIAQIIGSVEYLNRVV